MKLRELEKMLTRANFRLVTGQGKGSHRKFTNGQEIVILSGKPSADAKKYQVKMVRQAVEGSNPK